MYFMIDIQVSNKTMQFTGHWLTECESWMAAMKSAYRYADMFMRLNSCNKIDYINVTERKACNGK